MSMNLRTYLRLAVATAVVAPLPATLIGSPTCSQPSDICTFVSALQPPVAHCCKDLPLGKCRNVVRRWSSCKENYHAWDYISYDNALQPCDDDIKKCGSWPQ